MDDLFLITDEHTRTLEARGHHIGDVLIRRSGWTDTPLFILDDVAMFAQDYVDVAEGRATVKDVQKRNAGKVFPDSPWP